MKRQQAQGGERMGNHGGDESRRVQELVAQERAALATALLFEYESVSYAQLMARTGLTYGGVYYLMARVARVLPVFCMDGEWQLVRK